MPDGRGARIALEAGFLVAVAAVLVVAGLLGVADVRPLWIVLVMLLAWVVVALLEWVAWREEPHWASGMPPRYYVPQQPLLPRPPGEELPSFSAYPRAPAEPRATEAPTWIATPEMREELLGWPAAAPEPEPVAEPPAAVEAAPEPAVDAEPEAPDAAASQAVPAYGPEELSEELLSAASVAAEPVDDDEQAGWPVDDGDTASDPWQVAELERDGSSSAPELEAPAAAAPPAAAADGEAAPNGSAPEPRRVRHRIDPFEGVDGRRRFWQRGADSGGTVAELPPLPRHVRVDRERDGDR